MFRVVFHPSSAAHNTVSTVSGINETGTAATCREQLTDLNKLYSVAYLLDNYCNITRCTVH